MMKGLPNELVLSVSFVSGDFSLHFVMFSGLLFDNYFLHDYL